ncbi:MAG: cytochrome c3 family protein [Gammaproteobacteria bacterium]
MNRSTNHRRRQHRAYGMGLVIGLASLGLLFFPGYDRFHVRGPMNTGHEKVKCASCHKEAPGTMRQQIQANLRFILGFRAHSADYMYRAVGNENCLYCHERPNDRHPVYRFLEPRFQKARENLKPHSCISCHAEHKGQRVTLEQIGYCSHCHKKTSLRKDPLDVPHDKLITLNLWDGCLGCHDFHGNHIRDVPKTVDQIIAPEKVHAYFQGGESPYGSKLRYKAKKEADNDR